MPKLPHPFEETYCECRVRGMGQASAWKYSWEQTREAGMETRQERPDVGSGGRTPPGIYLLPKEPESKQALSNYAHELDHRARIVERKHELKQIMLAQEMPDRFAYIYTTLEEVIGRSLQERIIDRGKTAGNWTYNSSAAVAASKAYLDTMKAQASLDSGADTDLTTSQLADKLKAMCKERKIDPRIFGLADEASGGAKPSGGSQSKRDPKLPTVQ